ncbi:unnamed protein product [Auanema sp. JU1783]|nr:unnamed protein product [Auanema sp. JU1783]
MKSHVFFFFLLITSSSESFKCLDDTEGTVDCDGFCLKTALVLPGSPVSLHAIHRECTSHIENQIVGCTRSSDDMSRRRLGPNIITCLCDSDLCNF